MLGTTLFDVIDRRDQEEMRKTNFHLESNPGLMNALKCRTLGDTLFFSLAFHAITLERSGFNIDTKRSRLVSMVSKNPPQMF